MNAFTLIFKLGVLFSAFAFLWFWIKLLIYALLPSTFVNQVRYFLQLMHSLFLGVLVLKFVVKEQGSLRFDFLMIISLVTFFLYLLRNIRSSQNPVQVRFYNNLYPSIKMRNDWEWVVACITLIITIFWIFFPIALESRITNWFYTQTNSLIEVPVLGWIFKIAGFFFLLGTLLRFIIAIRWMLFGGAPEPSKDENKFDDFEEIK